MLAGQVMLITVEEQLNANEHDDVSPALSVAEQFTVLTDQRDNVTDPDGVHVDILRPPASENVAVGYVV